MKAALHALTVEGLEAIQTSRFGVEGFRGAIAYYDTRKDELITPLSTFVPAVNALQSSDELRERFGAQEARRIALQFVFNAYPHIREGASRDEAFERVWGDFEAELASPTWTFAAVANLQNFECGEHIVELDDGVSVRSRSFTELKDILKWTDAQVNHLAEDWQGFGASSFVLLVRHTVPKTPDNFLLANDVATQLFAARTLLALRLTAPGDIGIGRLFFSKPMSFNVGIGGMQSTGLSVAAPGRPYILDLQTTKQVSALYAELVELDKKGVPKNIGLALRSFASMYERHFHQAEDRILDAITALEALWKLDAELAFRLAFRTSFLLGANDDERLSIFNLASQYYKVRSKIVHGSVLGEKDAKLVLENEDLRDIVRRALKAFIHLTNHPADWTVKRFESELDGTLVHGGKRDELRRAMGLPVQPVPAIPPRPPGSISALAPRP